MGSTYLLLKLYPKSFLINFKSVISKPLPSKANKINPFLSLSFQQSFPRPVLSVMVKKKKVSSPAGLPLWKALSVQTAGYYGNISIYYALPANRLVCSTTS